MNRRDFAVLSTTALSVPAVNGLAAISVKTIDLPNDGNATPYLVKAIASALKKGEAGICLPAGEFHFWPEGGERRFLHISNNDDADNDIAVLLENVDGFSICGNKTRLIFHGRVTPFVFRHSQNINLSGVRIDWERPFHCEGNVLAVSPTGNWIEFEIPKGFSYRTEGGQFYFVGEGFEQKGIKNILEFDRKTRESRYNVTDNFFKWRTGEYRQKYNAMDIGSRTVRLEVDGKFRTLPKVGNRIVIMPPERLSPAIFIETSENIAIDDVTINHSGCMGIIAQTSSDIRFTNSSVQPSGSRYVSTTVDATHFVNCAGTIRIEDNFFTNHIDDAVNVHGIYVRIKRAIGADTVEAEYFDHQHRGVKSLAVGDMITIADAQTVNTYFRATVREVEYLNARDVRVRFSRDIPRPPKEGDVINVLSRQANLILRNNKIGRNRARGCLISTGGQVLVEGNTFHTPGSAIRISGGVDFWYESGPTQSILIRKNIFDHCKYGIWGRAIIDVVCVDKKEANATKPYHGDVVIVGNDFRTHHDKLVAAYRVRTLVFADNKITTTPYKQNLEWQTQPIIGQAVRTVRIDGNTVNGDVKSRTEMLRIKTKNKITK